MSTRNLLFYILLFFSVSLFSQDRLLEKKVSVSGHKNPKQTIKTISKTYGVPFVYSDNIFENHNFDTLSFENVSLEHFLYQYFAHNNIYFKEVDNQIILFYKKYDPQYYTLSGFIRDEETGEDLIGATVFFPRLSLGAVSNSYGYYSLKVPEGTHKIVFNCLSYGIKIKTLTIKENKVKSVGLKRKAYEVREVKVVSEAKNKSLSPDMMNMEKMDIETLKMLPSLFGENDALRNLAVFPGIQTNELSTGSINIRGGSTDQTLFLMDEANLYNASHFGGMFSVFNPDVVNNVKVYKSDVPVSEGGSLSSLIDVRLREGNSKQWKLNGSLGLISSRASIEGPLVKDKSSVLFAFRRTYADHIIHALTNDKNFDKLSFYFYDTNLKFNVKLNNKNRIFVSGYSGKDEFDFLNTFTRQNHLASIRWNHLFNPKLFSNTTIIGSKNIMSQYTKNNELFFHWESVVRNIKAKSDFTYYYSDMFKSSFGYAFNIYNIDPFAVFTDTENNNQAKIESVKEHLLLNSLYFKQHIKIKRLTVDAGLRFSNMLSNLNTDSLQGLNKYFIEPQIKAGFLLPRNYIVKISLSRHVQPLHQLPVNMVGITTNRWFPANQSYTPQESINYSAGLYRSFNFGLNISFEAYYRDMSNLLETFSNAQIIRAKNPSEFLFRAKSKTKGLEWLLSYNTHRYNAAISYDYCRALWTTDGLNAGLPYPASHTREHNINLTSSFSISKRVRLSAAWVIASGLPFTAPVAVYEVNGKRYLEFDEKKINTQKLPTYHRLDFSLDIAGKKNDQRLWKSFWNFSVYNAYLHKNALGVAYFYPTETNGIVKERIEPGYFYLYKFVPSVSYRFSF